MLVHSVFEGFAAVNEDDRDFVSELAAKLIVAVDIDLLPIKTAATMELGKAFLHDLAKMTSLARIEDNPARLRHGASVTEFCEAPTNLERCQWSAPTMSLTGPVQTPIMPRGGVLDDK